MGGAALPVSAAPPPRDAEAERKASKLSGWSGESKEPRRLFASPSLLSGFS